MIEKYNRYDRHLNQRALEKKSRVKAAHIQRKAESNEKSLSWAEFELQEMAGAQLGIISSVRDKRIMVMCNDQSWDAILAVAIPAKLGTRLVVGDRVFFTTLENSTSVVIEARQPRVSVLSRFKGERHRVSVLAQDEQIIGANIDRAVIVVAKKHPAFHPRFVDRYLVICENGGIAPLVCMNKSDLSDEDIPALEWYRSAGIPVIETSVTTKQGIDALKKHITGKTIVFVGNSGVGKSSLVNAILGAQLETKEVSLKTGKGRHTTTASSLYHWSHDSYVIDTPGIRSLGVFHIDKLDLQGGFPEFKDYVNGCQYSDCSHSHEPICGVRQAVDDGHINQYRYESYTRMLDE